jgi:uncharacterized RDD family membrane protein YckC
VFCPHCGAQAADDARFCRSCGKSLSNSQAAPAPPGRLEPTTTQASPVGVPRSATLPSNVAHMEAVEAIASIQYAGFWRRFAAAIIDAIILYVISFIVGFVIGFIFAVVAPGSDVAAGLAAVVGFFIGLLYYPIQECSPVQATLGKRALGIKVTDLNGQRIGFWRALWRNLAKLISALILLIGYLMAAFTARKQALHDILAGCLVVRGS